MKKFKYSVSSTDYGTDANPLLLKGSVIENLKKAADLGYDALEIHTRETAQWDYDAIRRTMEETGLSISAIATGKLCTEGLCSLTDDRPYVSNAALQGLKQYVDMAGELQTGIVLGWAKGNVPAGKNPAPYLTRLADCLKYLNAYGMEKCVPIYIEVINHYEVNVFNTCQPLVDFLEENQLDNCYVHLDSYHMMLEESDYRQAILTAGAHLGYFHIADNQRWYPGSGELDFTPMFETLEEIGYDGYVSVECFPRGDGEETARKAIAYLKSLSKG